MSKIVNRDPDPNGQGGGGGGQQTPPGELPPEQQPAGGQPGGQPGGQGGQTPAGGGQHTPPGGQHTPPGGQHTPPSGNQETIPKTKDEWDRLSQENPSRWIQLTQTRMDQTIRQSRETAEKLRQAEQQNQNLSAELQNLRGGQQPGQQPGHDPSKPFSQTNMPQNDEQWEQLWLENPNLASDLRNYQWDLIRKAEQIEVQQKKEFIDANNQCVREMALRHPDMYKTEKDSEGKIRVGNDGKPIFIINPNTGLPFLDEESSKFKCFEKVFIDDK